MRTVKGQFVKGGVPQNKIWTEDYLKSKLSDFVVNFYTEQGFVLPSTQIKSYDSKLFSAFRLRLKNPNQYYLNLLVELGLPLPSNSYYKDNHIFRGFYELVGYCFIKSWSIPFEPFKNLNFDGKFYVSDGFFTEINVYWEHWGGLNPNNKIKKEYYETQRYSLIQTIDDECQKPKNGIKYLYDNLRESLLPYYPNIPPYIEEDRLKLISASVPDFEQIIRFISEVLIQYNQINNIDERILRETKDGYKVIAFMNKFFDGRSNLLKEELNKRGFNYNIKAERGSYKSEDYFIKQITPIIKKLGRVPTQQEFSNLGRNDLSVMSKRYYGGLEQLRRNELEEGQMFYVVKNILDNPPYDKKLEWGDKTHETVKKIIKYFNDKGITIPSTLNDLRYDNIYEPFGKSLHTQITGKQIGGWENFKKIFNT